LIATIESRSGERRNEWRNVQEVERRERERERERGRETDREQELERGRVGERGHSHVSSNAIDSGDTAWIRESRPANTDIGT